MYYPECTCASLAFYPKAFNYHLAGRSPGFLRVVWPSRSAGRTVAMGLNNLLLEDYSCGNSSGITPDSLLRLALRKQVSHQSGNKGKRNFGNCRY